MNYVPFLVMWGLLAIAVLALFVWRKAVASGEDDNLHVMDGGSVEKSAAQATMAHRLEVIDRWGKIVTVVTIVYGLVLGGVYAWQSWVQNSRIGV